MALSGHTETDRYLSAFGGQSGRAWACGFIRVAAIDPFRSAEEVAQFGRGLFLNFLWKEMTGIERPATDIRCPGSP
jgi:hypothetical protein